MAHPQLTDDLLLKGCLCRLRMFSEEWQFDHGIKAGDRVVCLILILLLSVPWISSSTDPRIW